MGCVQEKNSTYKSPKSSLSQVVARKSKTNSQIVLSNENIYKLYKFDKLIGSGKFGIVKLAYPRQDPSRMVAIKSIAKETLKENVNMLKRELNILRNLDHPNVARFYETYEDEYYVHFVMEYCDGGDLCEQIYDKKIFDENEVQKIMLTLFRVMSYIHFKGIIHRDLKPQNILISKSGQIKLIDFGLSKKYSVNQHSLHTQVGTPLYVAPEVIDGKYSYECDNWSLGVIMYILLCGQPPFYDENQAEVYKKIKSGYISFEEPQWIKISNEAKNLIKQLININYKERLKSNEALEHIWFNSNKDQLHFQQQSPLKAEHQARAIKQLKNYSQFKRLKKEALKIFIAQLREKDILELYDQFRDFDIEKNGIITVKEMMQVMQSLGHTESEHEVSKLISQFFSQNNEDLQYLHINYSEFIAATMDQKLYLDNEKLWNMFQYFDTDKSGEITLDNLRDVMNRTGRNMPKKEILQILSEGPRKIDKINFQEFSEIMKDNDFEDNINLLENLQSLKQS